MVRRVLVVSAAEKAQPIRRVLVRSRPAVEVVELEPFRRGATPALAVDEGAAAPVALVDKAPDRVGHVARGAGTVFDGFLRLASDGEALLLDLLDQEVETALDDLGEVCSGSFRIAGATGGLGAMHTTISSIWRLDFPAARARTSR